MFESPKVIPMHNSPLKRFNNALFEYQNLLLLGIILVLIPILLMSIKIFCSFPQNGCAQDNQVSIFKAQKNSKSEIVSPEPILTSIPPTATPAPSIQTAVFFVSPKGNDANNGLSTNTPFAKIQKAIDLAQPGTIITLLEGEYRQNVVTHRNGTKQAPITITGPQNAIVRGSGGARIIEVNHDFISLKGFTVDGLHGDAQSKNGYRDKLLYVQGTEQLAGVTGLKVLNMTFKNAGGECVRLRYFAQNNEFAFNTVSRCGVHDFAFKNGGKNGEGIYIGTAPEQTGDDKNPTKDTDQSNNNWVHDNVFNTQGNECVDIKEGARDNLVEKNTCTGQKDPESGGMDSRGNNNTFRANEIFGNVGAGVRLGGDESGDGIQNSVYDNVIKDNKNGGIKFMRELQGKICGNTMSGNDGGNSVGSFSSKFDPVKAC